jgi:hypothetical protein
MNKVDTDYNCMRHVPGIGLRCLSKRFYGSQSISCNGRHFEGQAMLTWAYWPSRLLVGKNG